MMDLDEPVELSEYQAIWPDLFDREQRALCETLHLAPGELEHIGSTAVQGLTAKPIVDLMLGISSYPPSRVNRLAAPEWVGWRSGTPPLSQTSPDQRQSAYRAERR